MSVSLFERRRLRAPVVTGICGVAIAGGVAAAAGWVAAAPVAAIAGVAAVVYYGVGGTDTDVGALIGARADERQTSVRLRVRAFGASVLFVVGTIAAVVAAALGRAAWPYAAVVGLGVVSFAVAAAFSRVAGRVGDPGLRRGGSRVDERQAAIVLHALQLAGIAMFVVSAVAGAAAGGTAAATPLRILATVFAVAVIVGFALFRPRA